MEQSAKRRDLEERTFRFAESVRAFVKQLPKTISNVEDIRQLVRASGSVAATESTRDKLAEEARELTLIFSAIISKTG